MLHEIDPHRALFARRQVVYMHKATDPLFQAEYEQVKQRLLACVGEGDDMAGTHRDTQRRGEVAYPAIEDIFLVLSKRVGCCQRMHPQIVCVGVARGEIMTARAIQRERTREVGVLCGGHDFDMRPPDTTVLESRT